MNAATTDTQQARAEAAAQAALALLPVGGPLAAGTPTSRPDDVELTGQAVRARFTGAAQGEVTIVVGQDLVDALADTPLGNLDLTQAVRPALEAATATLGPVVVDPGEVMEPADAMRSVTGADGVLVPLVEGDTVRAVVGLAVAAVVSAGDPALPVAREIRSGFDLLHDVEMEVTAELGRTRMSVRELLSLTPGAVIELDRAAGGPADLLVNGRLIARGEVVVIDENFGIRITEIVGPSERA